MIVPEISCITADGSYSPGFQRLLDETSYLVQVFEAHQQPTDASVADGLEAARQLAVDAELESNVQHALGKKAFELLVQRSNTPTNYL